MTTHQHPATASDIHTGTSASTDVAPASDNAAPALNAITQLCRSSNLIRRHLERTVLRDARLTWTSYDILQLAISRQPIDTRTIAEVACVSKATVTISTNHLVDRALIRRGFDTNDNRRVLLHPTPAAWQLIQHTRARLGAEIQQLLRHNIPGLNTDATTLLRQIVTAEPAPHQPHTGDPTSPAFGTSREEIS
jgi:DNA-binding MarR family transcriptional regulator